MIEIISIITLAIVCVSLVVAEVIKKYLDNMYQVELDRYQIELTQLQLQSQEELKFSDYKE